MAKNEKNEKMLVLDRLKNIMTSTPEVERWIAKAAQRFAADYLKRRFSIQAARVLIRDDLNKWLHQNGFTGHGSSKLVGKAMKKALDGYEGLLKAALMEDIKTAKKSGHYSLRWKQADMAAGRIGKNLGYFK